MLEYWLWLTGRRGVGLRGLRALLEQFGTPEAVYCAAAGEYPQELRPEGRAALADKELAPARQILQQCYRKNIHVLTFQDAVYPNRLKNLDDAPLVLYYQGVFPDFDAEPVIAMVGTRIFDSQTIEVPHMDCFRQSAWAMNLAATAQSLFPAVQPELTPWRCAGPYPPERRLWRCLPAVWMLITRQVTEACLKTCAPTAASSANFRQEHLLCRSIFRLATDF